MSNETISRRTVLATSAAAGAASLFPAAIADAQAPATVNLDHIRPSPKLRRRNPQTC